MREQIAYWRHGPTPDVAAQRSAPLFPDSPWAPDPGTGARWCNVCGWTGDEFGGDRHVEGAVCPRCTSNARDRFLFACFVARTPRTRWLRVLETSPRLHERYHDAMATWFTYTASDFDESAHRADVRLDLQAPDLPAGAYDVVLSAHVLEHVPDTGHALDGVRRLLAPGGRLYLQVPVLQGETAPPVQPEFHMDNTPVFWRFGFDLAETMTRHGFQSAVLVTEPFADALAGAELPWHDRQWDVPGMLPAALRAGVEVAVTTAVAARLGLWESYQFVTFEGRAPSATIGEELVLRARRAAARVR
jgi:SAM-dependent methyltransferase